MAKNKLNLRFSEMPLDTKISQSFTVSDWIELSQYLISQSAEISLWRKAFDIFENRFRTRFFDPINKIFADYEMVGEGFAAAALQCILVETLEAFYQGKIYRPPYSTEHLKRLSEKIEKPLKIMKRHCQPNEYASSAKLIRDFVLNHKPFKSNFISASLVDDFYREIRCGLLHEAATKGKAKIRALKSEAPECLVERLDDGSFIFYRLAFQKALESYIKEYKEEILSSSRLRGNFLRKMDDVCQIKRIFYFAYGSNMSTIQLKNRINFIHDSIPGYVENYRFKYNKKSKDGSSKANIVEEKGKKVYGVCFEIDKSGFDILKNKFEKGYNVQDVSVTIKNGQDNFIIAKTFISSSLINSPPMEEYAEKILVGAKEHGLPENYIKKDLSS